DVGLLGMPNAGKSTFLSRITSARPKVADYPFTTLEPNLGVVEVGYTAIVVADIPGLIEGASEGAGLGHRFLRHVERTRLLVHLLDGSGADPVGAWRTLNAELAAFSQRLAGRPQIVVINKIDLPDTVAALPRLRNALRRGGAARVLTMSALTGRGVRQVVEAITAALATLPEEEPDAGELPVLRPLEDGDAFTVYRVVGEEAYRVKGRRIERAAAMTDFSNDEAVDRFHRILEAMGVTDRLRALGIADGQAVRIGDSEFEWAD
ncbi:MAG: Obg family GTPase CgtA, partial [Anaerolineae bacterium]